MVKSNKRQWMVVLSSITVLTAGMVFPFWRGKLVGGNQGRLLNNWNKLD